MYAHVSVCAIELNDFQIVYESGRISSAFVTVSQENIFILIFDGHKYLFFFSLLRWGETESTWNVGHCLAYCNTSG
jgi:hypothetical protein